MADFSSPTYPYERVQPGYLSFRGAEKIPSEILTYLLDLPDAFGYFPADDNSLPRVRLIKYLWHDGKKPLAGALPTPEEKLSLLYNGEEPVLNTDEQKKKHPKGYRIFPQLYFAEAVTEAKSMLKLYIGKVTPVSPLRASIELTFELVVNSGQDNASRSEAYSRLWAMECSLIEALHGVNICGVGVIDYSRGSNYAAGSAPFHDGGAHLYRVISMSVDWLES